MNVKLAGGIKAACGRAEITDLVSLETRGGRTQGPPRRAGKLHATGLIFSDGRQEILLVALDLLELYTGWMQVFKRALEINTGIPVDAQMIWCNHIHASSSSDGIAPVALAERTARAVEKARLKYAPVETAFVSQSLGGGLTIRRRFSFGELGTYCCMFNETSVVEGKALNVTRQARHYLTERGIDPRAWKNAPKQAFCTTPADTRLEILSVRTRGRHPLATIVRFPVHPAIATVVAIGNVLYPDFIGGFRDDFEKRCGGKVLWLCGPSGDVRPLHGEYGMKAARDYGRKLAARAGKLMMGLRYRALNRTSAVSAVAALPLKKEYRRPIPRVAEELERLRRAAEAEQHAVRKMRLLRRCEELEWVVFFQTKRPTIVPEAAIATGKWRTQVAALKLGNDLISALPGEIFTSTGTKVLKQLRKIATGGVMVTELAHDYISYLSPPEEYETGGYEDTNSYLGRAAERELLKAAVASARVVCDHNNNG